MRLNGLSAVTMTWVAAACGGSNGGPETAPAAALRESAVRDDDPDRVVDTLDLLTTASGASLVSGGGDDALVLIDGDPDGGSWRTDYPREMLPVSVVFELGSPARIEAVGVENAGASPGGVEGGAARSIRFEGSAAGPDEGYVALAALEAKPEARTLVPVGHAGPVRWIRVTIDTDHGGGKWVHLDEVIALGEPVADPLPGRGGAADAEPD